jgi:hypothetical protein
VTAIWYEPHALHGKLDEAPSGANECDSETDVINCEPDRFPFPRAIFSSAVHSTVAKNRKKLFPRAALLFLPLSVCTQQRGTKPSLPAAGILWSPPWIWQQRCRYSYTRLWRYVHLNQYTSDSGAKNRSWKMSVVIGDGKHSARPPLYQPFVLVQPLTAVCGKIWPLLGSPLNNKAVFNLFQKHYCFGR